MSIVPRQEYGATYEEYPPPPTPIDTPQQAIVSDATLGTFALAANILITTIIIVAMLVDGTQARTAIVVGAAYFGVSSFVFSVVTTGTLTSIVNSWQREQTERRRVAAYLALGTMALRWRMEVERNRTIEAETVQTPHAPPAVPAERLSPLTTFVEPYANEERAALEGIAWAEKLYDGNGEIDPRKVHPNGQLRIRVIGSKRGGGNREAGAWLLRQRIIVRVDGGYSLNVARFPRRHYVSALMP
jgi:hypothetical protein